MPSPGLPIAVICLLLNKPKWHSNAADDRWLNLSASRSSEWDSRWYYPWYENTSGFPDAVPWSYGAVEVYSAASNISSYWEYFPYQWFATSDWRSPYKANFLKLVQLRILQQKKALYSQLGLPVVRQVINQLRPLTGQPLLTDPPY